MFVNLSIVSLSAARLLSSPFLVAPPTMRRAFLGISACSASNFFGHFAYVRGERSVSVDGSMFYKFLDSAVKVDTADDDDHCVHSESVSSGVEFSKSVFLSCSGNSNGGAIYCASGESFTVSMCQFRDCSATLGGAIYLRPNEGSGWANVDNMLNNNYFARCKCTSQSDVRGAAVHVAGTRKSVTFEYATVDECDSSGTDGDAFAVVAYVNSMTSSY